MMYMIMPGDASKICDTSQGMPSVDCQITIAVSTMASRVGSISEHNLPQGEQWRYLLLWQADADIEVNARAVEHMRYLQARRSDIEFLRCEGRGVAYSRNRAIQVVSSEILLFSDDDVALRSDGLIRLIDVFRRMPDVALMSCITLTSGGEPAKRYPPREGRMTLFNCARVGTVELAVRPRHIRRVGVEFDVRFGAGSENFIGDEYIFVTDCLRKGLKGWFVPVPVAVHHGPSSGDEWGTRRAAVVRARVMERVFGPYKAIPVKLFFILRHRGKFAGFRDAVRFSNVFLKRHYQG
jgi:glycosyltransferase involved in cell wall biosynthesis